MPRPGSNPRQPEELHRPGTFEGRNTNWAAGRGLFVKLENRR